MQQWRELHRESFVKEVVRLSGRGGYRHQESCAECAEAGVEGVHRCDDCFTGALFCAPCIVKLHRDTPFHRISVGVSDQPPIEVPLMSYRRGPTITLCRILYKIWGSGFSLVMAEMVNARALWLLRKRRGRRRRRKASVLSTPTVSMRSGSTSAFADLRRLPMSSFCDPGYTLRPRRSRPQLRLFASSENFTSAPSNPNAQPSNFITVWPGRPITREHFSLGCAIPLSTGGLLDTDVDTTYRTDTLSF
jgi:hypothetical protein